MSYERRHVHRTWKICYNCIKKRLNTLVFKCRTAHYRYYVEAYRSFSDSPPDHVFRDFLTFKIKVHHLIIVIRKVLYHFGPGDLDLFFKLRRHFCKVEFCPQRVIVDYRFSCYKVYHTGKSVFHTNRYLNRNSSGAKTLAHLVYDREKVRTYPIHFVDESYPGNMIFICLTPYCF